MPVLLDKVPLPETIREKKYTNFTDSYAAGLAELLASIKAQEVIANGRSRKAHGLQIRESKHKTRRVADITLNLTVDSSLDGEKLEKQLALLRRFGLI